MENPRRLPKLISYVFAVLACLSVLTAAVDVLLLMAPPQNVGTNGGDAMIDISPQAGSVTLKADAGGGWLAVASIGGLYGRHFHGTVRLNGAGRGRLMGVMQRYGTATALLYSLFFIALFELMRRLFRNVGRGDCFVKGNIRLVQAVGGALLVLSLASAAGEVLLSQTLAGFFHGLVPPGGEAMPLHYVMIRAWTGNLVMRHGFFFSGLLVLALAEVFRQGFALRQESELTI